MLLQVSNDSTTLFNELIHAKNVFKINWNPIMDLLHSESIIQRNSSSLRHIPAFLFCQCTVFRNLYRVFIIIICLVGLDWMWVDCVRKWKTINRRECYVISEIRGRKRKTIRQQFAFFIPFVYIHIRIVCFR